MKSKNLIPSAVLVAVFSFFITAPLWAETLKGEVKEVTPLGNSFVLVSGFLILVLAYRLHLFIKHTL